MADTLEVSIKGQDRRHVVDILLEEIKQRIYALKTRQMQRAYNECQRQLDVSKLSKKVQNAFFVLQHLDEESRVLHGRIEAAKKRLEDALGDAGVIDKGQKRSTGWYEYVIRETPDAYRERVEGNAETRRKKIEALEDLRDRLLVAMATDRSLEPFIQEFRQIGRIGHRSEE